MDHARHLSSPSPTSSFLFHHPDRSYKSTPLTPLLSSAADVTSVDDCFSGSTTISGQTNNNNSFDGGHHHHHHHHHNHHHHHHHHDPLSGHHVQHHHGDDQCVIDHDSLTGVDDDDGMHNMLSGSSTSSTSTMPLLTESHSHHPFSRISLEEYSPLSLVEDCDNALTISPTSLACGSHHPFKSSLNGLAKIDNLVDVGVDDVVVGDARSMSPNLLSASTSSNHNNHLWSNSSTAITQNPALLSSTSTSFLLSHHHHHHQQQLNSLMQQLEPQSLDEPPPLLNNGSSPLDSDSTTTHRPSSEPPPGCGFELNPDDDVSSKLAQNQTNAQTKSNRANGNSIDKLTIVKPTVSGTLSSSSTRSSSRKSRSRSGVASKQSQTIENKTNVNNQDKSIDIKLNEEHVHSSKEHLQLNHHKKLKELQQRLFGTTSAHSSGSSESSILEKDLEIEQGKLTDDFSDNQVKFQKADNIIGIREEADSSANFNGNNDNTLTDGQIQSDNKQQSAPLSSPSKSRSRPARNRPSRGKNNSCSSSSSSSGGSGNNLASNSTNTTSAKNKSPRLVTTETAEPDTTTKTSDCIKLADLLSTTNSTENKGSNISMVLNNSNISHTVDGLGSNIFDNNEKRIQQIQLQVSPSLTVVANGGLIQPFNIQQGQVTNGTPVTSSNFTNQILCRPQTVIASNANCNANQSLKSNQTGGNSDSLKANNDGAILSNWTLQAAPTNINGNSIGNNLNSNNNNNNNNICVNNSNSNINSSPTIGTHQIAIQVICQDGTSLVLPVTSSAGLNAAVSLTSQHHQQLQAVLANNINNNNGNNNSNNQLRNQVLPFMSVSNLVAQQQQQQQSATNENGATKNFVLTSSNHGALSTQNSGLAANSPTLAALLDAGSSNRSSYSTQVGVNNSNDCNNANPNGSSGGNFIAGNLLRKLVSGNSSSQGNEVKRNDCLATQIGVGKASIVTVCAANNSNSQTKANGKSSTGINVGNAEKKIKLENVEINNNNIQATLTLIDPQGLIVANGNDKLVGKQAVTNHAMSSASALNNAIALQQQLNSMTTKTSDNSTDANNNNVSVNPSSHNKQSKMASSTGNRQVDPAQPFRCEHCNSTFTRLGNFTRHKKIHTVPTKDGQRFKCEVCSKSFLQRCDLARHLHIHRGTEPHRCNICGKGYIRHSDLVTHQRFHNKEKPFGCPHCSKGFCQRGDLNRHLRSIHLQMKPILCPCCNRKFAKQETLLRHLNTAHRNKPGSTSATTVIADLPPNYTTAQANDNQASIAVITGATPSPNSANGTNGNVSVKNNAPVASLQAIQATLCKVQQSVDSTNVTGLKAVLSVEETNTAKAVS